jgi:UDP-N-acetylglucosamine 2-epimerase
MSLPLADLRARVTLRTDAVLEARHRSTGRDKSEIAREVLDAWAELEIHSSNVLQKTLQREGISGEDVGLSRKVGA